MNLPSPVGVCEVIIMYDEHLYPLISLFTIVYSNHCTVCAARMTSLHWKFEILLGFKM